MPLTQVEIFTDGACSGNPGPGGYGALLRYQETEKEIQGYHPQTTNNRMELLAPIKALELLNRPCQVTIYTDSQYVYNGITKWIHGWQKRNWINSQRQPVANKELWQRLLQTAGPHDIHWQWVRGHSGHPENERCDRLAREAIRQQGPITEDDA